MVGDKKVWLSGVKVSETVLSQPGDRAANDLFVHVIHHVELKLVRCPDSSYHLPHFFDVSVRKDITCQQFEVFAFGNDLHRFRYFRSTERTDIVEFMMHGSPYVCVYQ